MLLINQLIGGRYKALELIGKGGMGNIYRALEEDTQREFALKELVRGSSKSSATPELFKAEFELLSRLDHPNIVKAYEIFEYNNELYYSMELLRGISLKDLISKLKEKNKFKENLLASLNILIEIAKGLKHVHDMGIIHHDLHPQNIQLIDSQTSVSGYAIKVIDFGISLLKEEQKNKTKDEIKVGMVNYKSPEHSRGELLDFTTDIYCFGAITYELLTGEQPFSLDKVTADRPVLGAYAAMLMHALRKVPYIKGLKKHVTGEINDMVQICMEKEPKNRYQSMQELIERLEDTIAKL